MKVLDVPKSGKCGTVVSWVGRFGNCARTYLCPSNPNTAAQQRVRSFVAYFSRAWAAKLNQAQRDRWIEAAANVPSTRRLAQAGPLTGEQLFVGINVSRSTIGLPALWEPPQKAIFQPNPVSGLALVNGDKGLRILLKVNGPVTDDIMVFGQAPCSAGRNKRRNVAYLGLLPPPKDGVSDITDIYIARYGAPRLGTKVFIVTRQQQNGWEGLLKETSDIVPPAPEGQQAAPEPALTLQPLMHTGCTRDAQGATEIPVRCSPDSGETREPGENAAKSALDGGGGGGGAEVR